MFHDGTEFQADAVKANFDRVTNKENALRRYSLYNNIAKTEVVDPYTARITLRKPFSAFINQLAHPAGVMICPKALAAYPGKQIAFHPCGTGLYTVKEYNPSEILHVVKNPNYWQKGLPKLDGITFKPVPENSTRVAMLRTGEAQFIFPVPPEQVKSLEGESGIEVTVSPSIIERYIAFNTKMKPFDNPKVRLALNYAVNKQALCKVAFNGLAVPATGLAPEGVDYAKQFEAIPYDPKKARELLKEAGYPNGFSTRLWSGYNNSTANKVIQFIQQQLNQVGIKTETRILEAGQRVTLVEANKEPKNAPNRLYYIGWSNSTVEADWGMRPIFDSREMPPKLSNEGYYSNPKVDELFDKAIAEVDEKKRNELYREVQMILWKEVPVAFLVYEDNTAASNKHLKNFNPLPDTGFEFYSAEWVD